MGQDERRGGWFVWGERAEDFGVEVGRRREAVGGGFLLALGAEVLWALCCGRKGSRQGGCAERRQAPGEEEKKAGQVVSLQGRGESFLFVPSFLAVPPFLFVLEEGLSWTKRTTLLRRRSLPTEEEGRESERASDAVWQQGHQNNVAW